MSLNYKSMIWKVVVDGKVAFNERPLRYSLKTYVYFFVVEQISTNLPNRSLPMIPLFGLYKTINKWWKMVYKRKNNRVHLYSFIFGFCFIFVIDGYFFNEMNRVSQKLSILLIFEVTDPVEWAKLEYSLHQKNDDEFSMFLFRLNIILFIYDTDLI